MLKVTNSSVAKHICLIVHATIACVSILTIFPAAVLATPIKAYRLKQETSSNGLYEVLISDRGVRLKSFSYDFEIVSRPPKWDVYAYRTSAKQITHSSLHYWQSFLIPSFHMFGSSAEFTKPKKVEHYQDKALSMIRYTFPAAADNPTRSYWLTNSDKVDIRSYELSALDVAVPQQASIVAYRIFILPGLAGAPYSMESIDARKGRRWSLRTLSFKEESLKDDKIFWEPTGFRDKGKITGVFLTDTVRGLGDDASELLGQ